MVKKNLKLAALKHEISINTDKVLEIVEKFNFVEKSEIFFESRVYNWIDSEPSEKDMDKVLKALGY